MSTEELGPRQRAAATKRERTTRALLDAARRLFDENGWHGTRVEDVVKAAHIGSATRFNYFPTKRALAVAAYAPPVLALMASTEKELATMATPEPTLITFIRELAAFLAAHPAMAVALLPLSRDPRGYGEDDGVTHVVNFRDLVEFISKLLVQCADARPQESAMVDDTVDFALSGLIAWIVQHPERSGKDAAFLLLNQLL